MLQHHQRPLVVLLWLEWQQLLLKRRQQRRHLHEQTTGPEIVDAFDEANIKLDYFVVPYGTGGTLKGVAKVLRERSPNTKIHVCEPDNAPMLYSGIKTDYPKDGDPATSFKSKRYKCNSDA
jgi:cysteine synthase